MARETAKWGREEGVGNCSVNSHNGDCVSVDCKVLILQPIAASTFVEDRA